MKTRPMPTRAELHREASDPEVTYSHLTHVTAERTALALEGIEDLLRERAALPPGARVFHVEESASAIIVTCGVIEFNVYSDPLLGKTSEQSARLHAAKLVEILNRHWGV